MSQPHHIKVERPGDTSLYLPSSSSAVVPLTSQNIQSLKPARKRKRSGSAELQREGEENGESLRARTSRTPPLPERLAPPKRSRRKPEKSLRSQLGMDVPRNYRSSSAYTGRGSSSILQIIPEEDLRHFKNFIYLIEQYTTGGASSKRLNDLRSIIHGIETEAKYNNEVLVKNSGILDLSKGLPRLVDSELNQFIPWDLLADARTLLARWKEEKYDVAMLRGILIEKLPKRINYKSDPEYEYQRVPCAVVGHNGLVNGQWWPIRQGCLRDGAHGEVEGGIAGKAGKGVFSVVLADGGYDDRDEGETIRYCGTESNTNIPSKGTGFLRSTLSTYRHPIRVLRAKNKKSIYAPKDGIRYDGLYNVVEEELIKPETALYRFKLQRIEGQEPIRYSGPEKRPTKEQLIEREAVWATFANN